MARTPSISGSVSWFDEHAGLGEVTADDGTVHGFHCTAIADGTRTIDVGSRVCYLLSPGRRGRWEAVELLRV